MTLKEKKICIWNQAFNWHLSASCNYDEAEAHARKKVSEFVSGLPKAVYPQHPMRGNKAGRKQAQLRRAGL